MPDGCESNDHEDGKDHREYAECLYKSDHGEGSFLQGHITGPTEVNYCLFRGLRAEGRRFLGRNRPRSLRLSKKKYFRDQPVARPSRYPSAPLPALCSRLRRECFIECGHELQEGNPQSQDPPSQLNRVEPSFPSFALGYKTLGRPESLGDLNLRDSKALPLLTEKVKKHLVFLGE